MSFSHHFQPSLTFQVSMTTSVIQTFLKSSNLPFVPLSDGLRLQVIPDISFLSRCQKHHFAAFVQDPGMLIVWDDDPEHVIDRAEQIEQHLVGMIWRSEGMKEEGDYKTALAKSAFTSKAPTININAKEMFEDGSEPDRQFSDKPRRVLLVQPILMAITGVLVILTIGVGWRKIAIELKVDHSFMRCLLAVVVPLQIWLGWVRRLYRVKIFKLIVTVLLPNTSQWHRSGLRPGQSGGNELEVLFWHSLSTDHN
jgi:hypothetical protein